MDEIGKSESHLSSAAAFVEGGIQDACDDACSICLEDFSADPATVTTCKHEFHFQCILEWCQRSSQCPMCWQSISLKDPTCQELLEAVELERSIRLNQSRATTIFHHPAYGGFELQHMPAGGPDAELEERIIQHLAAAAAIGRAHHISRREGRRTRSGSHGRSQFLVMSAHQSTPAVGSVSPSSSQNGGGESPPAMYSSSLSAPLSSPGGESPQEQTLTNPAQVDRIAVLTSRNSNATGVVSTGRGSAGQSTPISQDRPGPSDFQAFSENLKSRLSSVSMRYKESITKSTRGWRERLFSRQNSVADLGSEVRREVNAGIATVSRLMERLDTRENRRTSGGSASPNAERHSAIRPSNEVVNGNNANSHPNETAASASCVATSGPN